MVQPEETNEVKGGFHEGMLLKNDLLGQWLNFKLFGITYLVGKIKFNFFFQGPLAE